MKAFQKFFQKSIYFKEDIPIMTTCLQKIPIIGLMVALQTISFSCTEKIEVGLEDSPPMLVVNAEFTSEKKIHTVQLNTTSSYFQYQTPDPVGGAVVKITDGTDTFLLKENRHEAGIYETTSKVAGKENRTYQLLISNVDIDNDGNKENYSASEYLNSSVIIDSIHVEFVKSRRPDGEGNYRISLFAQEPEPIGNCYLFKVRLNDGLLTDSLRKFVVQYDYIYNGNYLDSIYVTAIQKTERKSVLIGDTITLECGSITSDYANFISETQLLSMGSNPFFGGPSANVWGNIKPIGKALGYFSVFAVYKVDRVYMGEKAAGFGF